MKCAINESCKKYFYDSASCAMCLDRHQSKSQKEKKMAKPNAPKSTNAPSNTPTTQGGKGGGVGPIHVPEDMGGGDLRLLPSGLANATLQKIYLGTSQNNQPKATVKFVITEEMDGVEDGEPSTIGETVLESFSLQPQALFKLNDMYKAVTGNNIPHGDFSPQEFEAMLTNDLAGTEWTLMLEQQIPTQGKSKDPRTVVVKRTLR